LFTGIVACSATIIVFQSAPSQYKTPTEWFDESVTDGETQETALTTYITTAPSSTTQPPSTTHAVTTQAAPTTSPNREAATTTTTKKTTSTIQTTTSFAGIKAASAKKLKTKATKQTTTTTTTTIPCGGDMQPPCQTGAEGCDEGIILGADNICHTPTCAPSVKSGRDGCGAFALKFCQPGEPSYKYLAGIDRIEVTNE